MGKFGIFWGEDRNPADGKNNDVSTLPAVTPTPPMEVVESVEIIDEVDTTTRNDISNGVGPQATFHTGRSYVLSFDGEKNYGELGPILSYVMDYHSLNQRSYQAYLESEIAQTVLDTYFKWIAERGLKLQMQPSKLTLETEGIKDFDAEKYNEVTEARWGTWSRSKQSSHNTMMSMNESAVEAFKHSNLGGDCLVVLYYIKGIVKVRIFDGYHLDKTVMSKSENHNKIVDGVEKDADGKHIAYHVRINGSLNTKRIEAWSASTGLRRAFLVYGNKYRLDDTRGVPKIATSLETLKKLERYKEAAVGSAEERQKIAYAIVHDNNSDGRNPHDTSLAKLTGRGNGNGAIPVDQQGKALSDEVSATTGKQAWNMPIGSKMEVLDSKAELFFKEFYETNAHIICAAVGIPPNVAFSMYNDSFSASRAATKDWEHTMDVERKRFQEQFYDPILAFWMHTQILTNKIQAPGYLVGFSSGNYMITESYLNARFTGSKFPHIDPLKEAKAERLKLGTFGDKIPLTTVEAATEALMSGDSKSNIEQFIQEIAGAAGLYATVKKVDPDDGDGDGTASDNDNDGDGTGD